MTREQFIAKYKEKFGCPNGQDICWCKICCNLEKMWKEIYQQNLNTLRKK